MDSCICSHPESHPSSNLGTTRASCSSFADRCQGCLPTRTPSWRGLGREEGPLTWGGDVEPSQLLKPTSEHDRPRTPVLFRVQASVSLAAGGPTTGHLSAF